ncbi:MAG TPA: DUF4145 domain-containing protein [Thermoanaerobaculia bacterium]|jgi:hypothetical protein|nr:DUF4145 domain-containing protein [Thermoanaerobaculia bacterium]
MQSSDLVAKRFEELHVQMEALQTVRGSGIAPYSSEDWQAWATSVMNLFDSAFGRNSVHYENFKALYDKYGGWAHEVESGKGIFRAAKADYDGGYVFKLEARVSGEIFGDLVLLAKEALANQNIPAAAVLAAAALEDALKRYALLSGVDVSDKPMQQVVAALKSKGLVAGAQKTLLDTMPKIRDFAMHANWDKLTAADASSVIGFVEAFLIMHF